MFKRKSHSLNQRTGCNIQEACGADGTSLQAVPSLPPCWFHTSFRWDGTWTELDVSVYSCLIWQIYLRWSHFWCFGLVSNEIWSSGASSHKVCALKSHACGAPFSTDSSQIWFVCESRCQTQMPHTRVLQVNMEVFQAMMSISVAGVFVSTASHYKLRE